MADDVTIIMSAEEAKLWQSITSTLSKMGEMERGFAKITAEARKSAKANQELERAATRVFQETRTPLERHTTKLQELNSLLARNKIDQETYNRAVQESQQRLRGVGDAGERAFGKAALGQLSDYVIGMASLGAITGKLLGMYREWRGEIAEIADRTREVVKEQVKLMAKAADFKAGEEIAAGLGQIPGATPAEKRDLFQAITGGAPQATVTRRLAMTRAAARAIPVVGGADLEALGALMGQMEEYAPGRMPEHLAALAVQAWTQAGERAAQLTGDAFKRAVSTLTFAGETPERAMATSIAALRLGQPEALTKMSEAIAGKWEGGPIRSPEDLRKYQFYQLGREERRRALLEDEDTSRAILEEASIKVRQIRVGAVAEVEKELVRAGTEPAELLEGRAAAGLARSTCGRSKSEGRSLCRRRPNRRQPAAQSHGPSRPGRGPGAQLPASRSSSRCAMRSRPTPMPSAKQPRR